MGFNLAPFIFFPFSLIPINATECPHNEGEHLSALTKRGSRWNSSILLALLLVQFLRRRSQEAYFGLYYIRSLFVTVKMEGQVVHCIVGYSIAVYCVLHILANVFLYISHAYTKFAFCTQYTNSILQKLIR